MDNRFIGRKIDDKYPAISVLGEGGLGTVYKAEHPELSRFVAIKIMHPANQISADNHARFELEAKVLAGLEHEHIVGIYSVGIIEAQRPYLVMEYLEGKTLSSILAAEGALGWERSLKIVAQICKALQHAHEREVIHRDLKPQNIILLDKPEQDYVKVLDFGLSKLLHSTESAVKITRTGALVGSVHYMAPEMCLGKKADIRSDVYSLGCILYECLSGNVPLDAEHPVGLLQKQIAEMPEPLPDSIPEWISLLTFKAIQKDPDLRFQTMSEFSEALNLALQGKEEEIKISGIQLGTRKLSQSAIAARALALIGSMLGILVLTSYYLAQELRKNAPKPPSQASKLANPEYRREQLKRAQDFVVEANNLMKQGRLPLANQTARRALLTISQHYSNAALNKELAAADLSLLDAVAPIFQKSKEGEYYGFGQIDMQIRKNDELFFDASSQAQLNEDMLAVSSSLGNFYDSMRNIYSATNNLGTSKQFSKAESFIKKHANFPTVDDEQVRIKALYFDMAWVNLLLAEGKKEAAEKLAKQVTEHVDAINNDPFLQYEFYNDLTSFHRSNSDPKSAVITISKAKDCGSVMTNTHPEAYAEAMNLLYSLYIQLNEKDKALLEYQELKSYSKELKGANRMRVDAYLRSHSAELGVN